MISAQVGSEVVSMKPISICQITYENSCTGTDLSCITSPPSRQPVAIKLQESPSEAQRQAPPQSLPKPPSPNKCLPSDATRASVNIYNQVSDAHAARMQLRTLLRLRKRTLQRLQALQSSIPEDSEVQSFDAHASFLPMHTSCNPTLLQPAMLGQESSIPAVHKLGLDSSQHTSSRATAHAAQSTAGNSTWRSSCTEQAHSHPEQHQGLVSRCEVADSARCNDLQLHGQQQNMISSSHGTAPFAGSNSRAISIGTSALQRDAQRSAHLSVQQQPAHSTMQAQHLVHQALHRGPQHAAAQQALAIAVHQAAQRAIREAAERSAQNSMHQYSHADNEHHRPYLSTTPFGCSSVADCSFQCMQNALSGDSPEVALKENMLPGEHESDSGKQQDHDFDQAIEAHLADMHAVNSSCSSSLGSARMQSLSETATTCTPFASTVPSVSSDVLKDEKAQADAGHVSIKPTSPSSMQFFSLAAAKKSDSIGNASITSDTNTPSALPHDFFESLTEVAGCVAPSPLQSESSSLDGADDIPFSKPCLPQHFDDPSPMGGCMHLQPCIPESSGTIVAGGDTPSTTQGMSFSTPIRSLLSSAIGNASCQDQYSGASPLGFRTAPSVLSGHSLDNDLFKIHSCIPPSTRSSIPYAEDAPPGPDEENSAFCRFMGVMSNRRNSVDLPPGLSGEEWSAVMPPSSSYGGLSSLGSPASKWGSQKLPDASPKALGCL
jgi:hypothetical protein